RPRAIPANARSKRRELVIEAEPRDVVGCSRADGARAARYRRHQCCPWESCLRNKAFLCRAEIDVQVFGPESPIIGEGQFGTASGGPTSDHRVEPRRIDQDRGRTVDRIRCSSSKVLPARGPGEAAGPINKGGTQSKAQSTPRR